jgi:hypothetical protein
MLRKLRPRSIYDVMAAIGCFAALATGTAYAANTIRSSDIVDNEVFTSEVRDDTLSFGGLFHQDLRPTRLEARRSRAARLRVPSLPPSRSTRVISAVT